MNKQELVDYLESANKAYRQGEPFISDAEYDRYVEKLKEIDPNHPYLNKVEEEILDKPKIKHDIPMLSIQKSFILDEVEKWMNRIVNKYSNKVVMFKVSPKLDGMAAKLMNGVLSTRGDGYQGFDITDAFDKGVYIKENVENDDFLLGEIVMNKNYFDTYLKDKYKHPRGVVVGAVKCDTLSPDQKKSLDDKAIYFYPFKLLPCYISDAETIIRKIHIIVSEFKNKMQEPIDGFIIEVVNSDIKKDMGNTNRHYRWNIAYKEQTDIKPTKVIDVQWQVGRGGHITPVLLVEPTELSGATISKVTAHNLKFLQEKQIDRGTTIELIRSGEVIPKIVNVLDGKVEMPDFPLYCPDCNQPTFKGETFLHCLNVCCNSQLVGKLRHFFKTLDIKGFGEKTCEKLSDRYKSVVDIYSLIMEYNSLREMGFGDKQAQNLISALKNSLNVEYPPYKLLAAIGINMLGEGDAKKLLKHHSFSEIKNLTTEKLISMDGFGEKKAVHILEGIQNNLELIEFIENTFEHSKDDKKEPNMTNELEGINIVFTGKSSMTRNDLFALAEKYLMNPQKSISKATKYLVAGDPNTIGKTKLDKAKQYDVSIISEDEFFAMLGE